MGCTVEAGSQKVERSIEYGVKAVSYCARQLNFYKFLQNPQIAHFTHNLYLQNLNKQFTNLQRFKRLFKIFSRMDVKEIERSIDICASMM